MKGLIDLSEWSEAYSRGTKAVEGASKPTCLVVSIWVGFDE